MLLRRMVACALVGSLSSVISVSAQEPPGDRLTPSQRASLELESVVSESQRLADPVSFVRIRSRAAHLLWLIDADRARLMFRDLWKWIGDQKDSSFDAETARTELLKNLFPRDPGMSRALLDELMEGHKSEDADFRSQVSGADPGLRRLVKIASELIEKDAALAASFLERSLSVSVTPAALVSLTRLRQRNAKLADYVAAHTLENLRIRPTLVGLAGVYMLLDYLFPSRQSLGLSTSGPPDYQLRLEYFSTAHEILQRSLAESESLLRKERGYSDKDIQFRALFLGQVAAILSVLAPKYAPALAPELRDLASRTTAGMPGQVRQLLQFTLARIGASAAEMENPEDAIGIALARGEMGKARSAWEAIEDPSTKKRLSQALASAEFKAHLDQMNLADALIAARRIEDPNLRAPLYAQIAKAAHRKGEVELARVVLAEAQSALSDSASHGVRAWALLVLAAEASEVSMASSAELLSTAVSAINSLKMNSDGPSKGVPSPAVDDPAHLLTAPELERAFSSLARDDFDAALALAGQIDNESIRLFARMAACGPYLSSAGEP